MNIPNILVYLFVNFFETPTVGGFLHHIVGASPLMTVFKSWTGLLYKNIITTTPSVMFMIASTTGTHYHLVNIFNYPKFQQGHILLPFNPLHLLLILSVIHSLWTAHFCGTPCLTPSCRLKSQLYSVQPSVIFFFEMYFFVNLKVCCLCIVLCFVQVIYGSFHINSTKRNPDPFRFYKNSHKCWWCWETLLCQILAHSIYHPVSYDRLFILLHLFTKMLISCFVNNIQTFCSFYWILN